MSIAPLFDEPTYFLIVFDHGAGKMLRDPLTFDDSEEASRAYEETERLFADSRDVIEVLLVASDSLDTVAKTHGLFFRDSLAAMGDQLAAM